MKIISVNIGKKQTITWRGKQVETGIYKYPVEEPLHLGITDVAGDAVVDRRYHGGVDKACYLFSESHYPYWKKLYPALNWQWGMFGENLTVEGMDEANVLIGDIYKIGTAIVQVTQPRQPCFKLGVRFGSQKVLPEFIEHGHPGVYVRVLKEGKVPKGGQLLLEKRDSESISVKEVFNLLYAADFPLQLLDKVIKIPSLAESCRMDLIRKKAI